MPPRPRPVTYAEAMDALLDAYLTLLSILELRLGKQTRERLELDPRAAGAAARPTGQSGSAGQRQALIRAQALAELLNDIAEYRAASHPALRAFWRVLALHDIARFRRDYLRPERAAFEAAVAASQRRRAA